MGPSRSIYLDSTGKFSLIWLSLTTSSQIKDNRPTTLRALPLKPRYLGLKSRAIRSRYRDKAREWSGTCRSGRGSLTLRRSPDNARRKWQLRKEATLSCMRHLSFNTILVTLLLSAQTLSDERKASSDTSRVDTRADSVLWRDPGLVARLDLAAGPGGKTNAPQGPYTFIKEIESGKKPKLKVRDARGSMWVVKWGHEVKAEIFASRLAWAAGYFTLPTYFVASGRDDGATDTARERGTI